jgi:hypothetical protein
MQIDLTHLPVNWIDGMKISRKTFSDTEFFIHEQVQDSRAIQLTDYNYGILPADKSLELSVFCDSLQLITVDLNSCKAITPDGCRIDIVKTKHTVQVNFKEIQSRFGLRNVPVQQMFILLTINVFKRTPSGQPQAEENPPRVPYTQPEIGIDVVPVESLNQYLLGNSLIIGKIAYQNNDLIFQREFIPACTSVDSLPGLLDWYRKFRQLLDSWEQACIRIIQKVNQKSQQSNSLTLSIQKVSEKILEKLVSQKINFQWIIQKSAPVHMCMLLLENLQYLYTIIICLSEKDREELINYFAEWADVQTGSIENITTKAMQIQYNHNDVSAALQDINQAYNLYVQLFQKLAILDFIGKRKGQNIFVIEQEIKDVKGPPPPPEKPSRWSPLS